MATIDELVVKILADTKELKNAFINSEKIVKNSASSIDRSSNEINKSLNKINISAVALSASFGLMGKSMLSSAGEFEQNAMAFEVMLGSLSKGENLLKDIIKLTKNTPFQLQDTVLGAKRLLAYNIEAEKVIPTLEALGNIASVVGRDRLPNLILAFGQVKTQTKLAGQELRQFTESSVPLIEVLAEQLNVTESDIKKMVSEGKIGFKEVEKAIMSLSSGSGRFGDLMRRQSTTYIGVLSNIKDAINIISINLGNKLLPTATKVALKFKEMLEDFAQINTGRKDELLNDIKNTEIRINTLREQIKKLNEDSTSDKLGKSIHVLSEAFRGTFIALQGGIPSQEKYISNTEGLNSALDSQITRLNKLKAELKTFLKDDNRPEFGPNLGMNKEEIESLRGVSNKTAESIKKSMNDSTESWSRNLSDAIIDSKGGFQSLADFANNVLRDIASQVVQSQIASPIVKSATDIFTNRNNNNSAPTIPTNTGAPVVQPTARAFSTAGSQSITINQTIQPLTGIDDSQVRAVVASQAPAIAEQAKISTLDAISRGGRARQVIKGV